MFTLFVVNPLTFKLRYKNKVGDSVTKRHLCSTYCLESRQWHAPDKSFIYIIAGQGG